MIDIIRKYKRLSQIEELDPKQNYCEKKIETYDMLEKVLDAISEKCYALLIKIYILGYKVRELVPEFGPNPHAVSQNLQRCLKQARKAIVIL